MGAWNDFNRIYHITPRDWDEWRRTKPMYAEGGRFKCIRCGKTVLLSPLLAFVLAKGKMARVCDDCKD